MKRPGILLAGVLGAVCLSIGPAKPAEPIVKKVPTPQTRRGVETFTGRIAKRSGVPEDDVQRVLKALGPVVNEDLREGKTVPLQGLGSLRITRLPEYRNLDKEGRPVIVAPRNTVEFLPSGELAESANTEGVEPAVSVPAFEYKVLPGQTPGQKSDGMRMPNVRVR